MSVDEAAAKIGICRSHAYALANAGGLPVIRMGRRLLVVKAAFEKLFEGGAA
jgi:excisionase family DNA binding protein